MALLQRIKTPFVEPPAEEPVRPRARMRSVGELLRERREELDLDLESVGEALRIKPAYLIALEQDRSHELPGAAYAMGFIKAYSRYLGLDDEAVLNRFKDESAGLTARPNLSLPVPLGERSLPGAAMLLIALILVLCGYGTWYYLSTGERSRPERVASVPPSLAQNLSPPAAPADNSGSGITLARGLGTTGGDSGPAPSQPAPSQAAAAQPQPEPPPQPAGAPAQPAAAPQFSVPSSPGKIAAAATAPAAPAGEVSRVSIKAVSDCWIQVRGGNDTILFSRVLRSGETYKVPAKTGLFLRTGNAGALQIAVDGKLAPSIGGIGTMRRNVALDPNELAAGTAIHG